MSIICAIIMLALPISTIWFWVNFPGNADALSAPVSQTLQIETIRPWQIIGASVYNVSTALLIAYGLNQLRRLFNNFKSGYFFTKESVQSLHHFSIALFASTVLKALSPSVFSLLLTFNNGPNKKSLVVSFGSNDFWLLFTAATFLAITWSFREGLNLAKENASFV